METNLNVHISLLCSCIGLVFYCVFWSAKSFILCGFQMIQTQKDKASARLVSAWTSPR